MMIFPYLIPFDKACRQHVDLLFTTDYVLKEDNKSIANYIDYINLTNAGETVEGIKGIEKLANFLYHNNGIIKLKKEHLIIHPTVRTVTRWYDNLRIANRRVGRYGVYMDYPFPKLYLASVTKVQIWYRFRMSNRYNGYGVNTPSAIGIVAHSGDNDPVCNQNSGKGITDTIGFNVIVDKTNDSGLSAGTGVSTPLTTSWMGFTGDIDNDSTGTGVAGFAGEVCTNNNSKGSGGHVDTNYGNNSFVNDDNATFTDDDDEYVYLNDMNNGDIDIENTNGTNVIDDKEEYSDCGTVGDCSHSVASESDCTISDCSQNDDIQISGNKPCPNTHKEPPLKEIRFAELVRNLCRNEHVPVQEFRNAESNNNSHCDGQVPMRTQNESRPTVGSNNIGRTFTVVQTRTNGSRQPWKNAVTVDVNSRKRIIIPLANGGTLIIYLNFIDEETRQKLKSDILTNEELFSSYNLGGVPEPRVMLLMHPDASPEWLDEQPCFRHARITLKSIPLQSIASIHNLVDDVQCKTGNASQPPVSNAGVQVLLYRDGNDHIKSHADKSQQESQIFTVIVESPKTTSPRYVVIKPIEGNGLSYRLNLRPGDAYCMDGTMQQHYKHGVPKHRDSIFDPEGNMLSKEHLRRIVIVIRQGLERRSKKDTGRPCPNGFEPRIPHEQIYTNNSQTGRTVYHKTYRTITQDE